MKKLVFAFMMYSEMNQEKIWYDFFDNSTLDYEILIHSKNEPKLDYLNKLTNTIYVNKVYNKWGRTLSVENFLMEESIKLNSDKIIFLSNSCIPAKNIDYIFNYLNDDYHYIKYGVPSRNRIGGAVVHNINYLMSNHQWCIIDKKHYSLFLNDLDRKYFEEGIHCSEECYYSSILNKYDLLNENEVKNQLITYVDWDRSPNGCNPYTFDINNPNDFSVIEQVKSDKDILFIRKISK